MTNSTSASPPAPELAVIPPYEAELLAQQRAAMAPAALLGAVLIVAFAGLDRVVVPQAFGMLLAARLAAAVALLGTAHVARARRVHPMLLVGLLEMVCLGPIELGVHASGAARSPYVVAAILVLAGVSLLLPLRLRQALGLQAAGLAVSLGPWLFGLAPGDGLALVPAASYLSSMGLIAVAGAAVQDRLRRREHRARAEVVRQAGLIEMGTMAGALAHELASPLTCALLDLDALERAPEEKARAYVETARRNLRRMGDILAAMQQGARKAGAAFREVDLARQIELAIGLATARTRWKHPLDLELSTLPMVECEPTLVGQVLVNLLVNALEVAHERVAVRARRVGAGVVVIEVEDDGPGVPLELRSRIFEPFFTTKGERGNGLGLWISAEIARLHGGTLEVERAPAGGALFRLTLPEQASAERRQTPPSLRRTAAASPSA